MTTPTKPPDDGKRPETESPNTILVVIDGPGDKTRRPRRPSIPYSPPDPPNDDGEKPSK